ncbi:predicted protein [Pyrenophora tritici-repentis Pt-1C-BFP]|uniref:Uncharacterized protein n=1 Tax=Pyrenophora tritici-repentis (strain Pt-1C-BFP) TaxID=426418 RepID=B2WIM1_PYRTR|nr:uncharacterized protein PTRG_09830 [Pyrenophora tritici-repentis Pt-1C-BFP]EDU42881.1 predicted protein [Pyrenophora tritici-repentis Pt-1C-BFP]
MGMLTLEEVGEERMWGYTYMLQKEDTYNQKQNPLHLQATTTNAGGDKSGWTLFTPSPYRPTAPQPTKNKKKKNGPPLSMIPPNGSSPVLTPTKTPPLHFASLRLPVNLCTGPSSGHLLRLATCCSSPRLGEIKWKGGVKFLGFVVEFYCH